MHRLILGNIENDLEVDHINHNQLDNRRQNLRIVNRSQNQQNKNGARGDNSSGYRNVYIDKTRPKKPYFVVVKVSGKEYRPGKNFKTAEEANEAAIELRKKYMPFSQEGTNNV